MSTADFSTAQRTSLWRRVPVLARWAAGAVLFCVAWLAVDHWLAEREWRHIRDELREHGVSLEPLADPPPIPDAENVFGQDGPFHGGAANLGYYGYASMLLPYPQDREGRPAEARRGDQSKLKEELLRAGYATETSFTTKTVARVAMDQWDNALGSRWAEVLACEARTKTWVPSPQSYTSARPVNYFNFRIAAQTHALRAITALEEKRSADALAELRGISRLVQVLEADPTFMGIMMQAALSDLAVKTIWDGLTTGSWTDADLAALDPVLAPWKCGTGWHRAAEAEMRLQNSFYEKIIAEPFNTRVQLGRQMFLSRAGGFKSLPYDLVSSSRPMLRRNQALSLRYSFQSWARFDADGEFRPENKTPTMFGDDPSWMERVKYAFALSAVVSPRAGDRVAKMDVQLRQARVAIALERYRRARGDWPDTLDALLPDFIPALPRDPFARQTFHYRREPGTGWRLWSIGPDLKNDDGDNNVPQRFAAPNDLVWPQSN